MKEEVYMRNIIIIVICALFFVFSGWLKQSKEPQKPKANVQVKRQLYNDALKGVEYNVYNLSDETIEYMKTKSEYSEEYNQNKKFIVYPGDFDDCPYGPNFTKELEKTRYLPGNAEHYNYHQRKYSGVGSIGSINTYEELDYALRTGVTPLPPNILFLTVDHKNLESAFRSSCPMVCIVNPSKKMVLSLDRSKTGLLNKLPAIFSAYQDW